MGCTEAGAMNHAFTIESSLVSLIVANKTSLLKAKI